jgi:Spy/CpxP family protein refolding chaperone
MGMAWPTMTMVHVTTPAVNVSPMMHMATTAMTVTAPMTPAAMLGEGLRWQHECSENS